MEFHDNIWNHHDKLIQKSTHLIIGSVEIDNAEIWESKQAFAKTKACVERSISGNPGVLTIM